jgi:peptidoglycan/LPS O-acetylase OafA/YrhL
MVTKSGLPELIDGIGLLLFNQHLPLTTPGAGGMGIALGYQDLALLPYCLYTVIAFSGRKLKYEGWYFSVLLLPLFYSIFLSFKEPAHEHALAFFAPVFYLCLSLVIRFVNWSVFDKLGRLMISLGAWLGGISYGIYIIHVPLLYFAGRVNVFDNQLLAYLIKLILFFSLVISIAYLLEKVFQPGIRNLLVGKKNIRPRFNPPEI